MAKLNVPSEPPPGPTVPGAPDEVDELAEVEEEVVVVVVDVLQPGPQMDIASVTHCVSQLLLQQKESEPQTCVAHGSHPDVSAAPDAQGECAHVSGAPEEELAVVVVVVVVVVELDAGPAVAPPAPVTCVPPHGFEFGTHTWYCVPSAPGAAMHVWSASHGVEAQSEAQYWSPANCAQSEPATQSEFFKHA
jgi:hypothetical protein